MDIPNPEPPGRYELKCERCATDLRRIYGLDQPKLACPKCDPRCTCDRSTSSEGPDPFCPWHSGDDGPPRLTCERCHRETAITIDVCTTCAKPIDDDLATWLGSQPKHNVLPTFVNSVRRLIDTTPDHRQGELGMVLRSLTSYFDALASCRSKPGRLIAEIRTLRGAGR